MHRLLTTLGRGFKERIGWKRLGIAASLLIIVFAVTTLVRTLKGVDTGVILTALTEIAPHRIALAALCVVGAFCTLTFYDFFALRTIGKTQVPYRIAALSSFTSYTIGHNIGATVFTGGAIRFRIYSDYGLTAIDVAKICFLSGLTFWLGNLFVLGFGMAWHPWAASAMDLLPPAMNRLIAIGCLAGIAAYFIWLLMGENRRELGQNGWKVVLPSARLTLVQILIGVVDLGFSNTGILAASTGYDYICSADLENISGNVVLSNPICMDRRCVGPQSVHGSCTNHPSHAKARYWSRPWHLIARAKDKGRHAFLSDAGFIPRCPQDQGLIDADETAHKAERATGEIGSPDAIGFFADKFYGLRRAVSRCAPMPRCRA